MADTPAAKQIAKLLQDTIDLCTKLQKEAWSDYDPTLQKALVLVMRPGFAAFQKAAKSIARVKPEETVSEHHLGDDWWNDALDEMR